jgi:3'-phosphoadenosine 5'-phosphosulfate sulfotransferase (PAPS reductase)/FAD synthetase
MQGLPLDAKIEATKRRIREWLDVYPDARVAFSGGKDSTVLLDIARQVSPGILASFANTGLEFPEIVEFVRSTPNVVEVRPKMDFLTVVQKYGYPVVSKENAHRIDQLQRLPADGKTAMLYKTGVTSTGRKAFNPFPKKYLRLVDCGIKISPACCKIMKLDPMCPSEPWIVGTMASEGRQRRLSYEKSGCNVFDRANPRSRPMSFWTENDVWDYIRGNQLPYSRIYDMGYHRTGCMFCMFGLHMEARPNRFERMAVTHPGLFRYCMDGPLKLREVIRFVYKMEMPAAKKKVKSVLD